MALFEEELITSPDAQSHAGRREWAGLFLLTLPALLLSVDLSALDLAVPRLSADLRPSSSQLLWIMDIYGFLLAGFLITMGSAGDRIGRRKLLMIGAASFGIASMIAAFSRSATLLIATRAVMGIAGATLAPSSLALISNMFIDQKQRTTAVAVWSASLSAGGALGPVLGGMLLEHFWWGSVFLLAVPVMALLLAAAPKLLPEYRNPAAGRLDFFSVGLSIVALMLVIYGIKQTAQDGVGWTPALSILAGIFVGVLFIRRERTLAGPLIDLRLFRIPAFSISLAVNLLGFFGLFGVFLFTAQYLQLVLALSPLPAGLWTAPGFIGFVLSSLLTPVFVRRVQPLWVMTAGLAAAVIGFATLTRIHSTGGLTVLVAGSVVLSFGLGPVFTLVTSFVLGSAPEDSAGAASGIAETSTELGGALGIAVLGSIGIAVYRSGVSIAIPAGLPAGVGAAARDTLGGAVAVAAQLPGQLGSALLEVTRDAFTHGLRIVAGTAAVITAIVALLAVGLLRPGRGKA